MFFWIWNTKTQMFCPFRQLWKSNSKELQLSKSQLWPDQTEKSPLVLHPLSVGAYRCKSSEGSEWFEQLSQSREERLLTWKCNSWQLIPPWKHWGNTCPAPLRNHMQYFTSYWCISKIHIYHWNFSWSGALFNFKPNNHMLFAQYYQNLARQKWCAKFVGLRGWPFQTHSQLFIGHLWTIVIPKNMIQQTDTPVCRRWGQSSLENVTKPCISKTKSLQPR